MSAKNQNELMLEDLAGLNRRFVNIALGGLEGPPAVSVAALAGLGADGRARLAGLPFALFSFGFGADAGWEDLRIRGVQDADPPPAPDPSTERFALLALAFLRHAVREEPSRAVALAGVPATFGEWLGSLELACLATLAPTAASRLRWRFAGREELWSGIVRACGEPDGSLYPVLRAAGLQWTIRRALQLGESECCGRRGFRERGR